MVTRENGIPPASLALPQGSRVVVTGQQVGVLTGPLLTVLKAARAVSKAGELSASGSGPVLPLFWAASDDHDLDEIHHTYAIDDRGDLRKLRIELPGLRGAASEVGVHLESGIALARELFATAGIDAGAFPIEPWLPREHDTLGSWFRRCLTQVLGRHAPRVVEPRELNAAARPVYERALRDDGAIRRALEAGAAANAAAALSAPLPADDDPPLFLIEAGARTRVRRGARPGEFLVGERTYSRAALLDLATSGLPRLSANVALRPIVQAATLPVLAYVAGPTEIVYYRQLEPLHRLFEVPFPELVRRPQATLLSTATARAARKLGVAPDALLAALAARDGAAPPKNELLDHGAALRRDVAAYVERLLAASPAVKSAADRRAGQLLQSFDGLLERAGTAFAEGEQVEGARWSALSTALRPRGRPQDRSLNVLPFLAERGPALIDALLALRGEPDAGGVVPDPVL